MDDTKRIPDMVAAQVRLHVAYVDWSPVTLIGDHEVTFDIRDNHSVKTCAAKNEEIEVTVECDRKIPDLIRHMEFGSSRDDALCKVRIFALHEIPHGDDYVIRYAGVLA